MEQKKFSLTGLKKSAKVLRIIDGDTLDVEADFQSELASQKWIFRIRMLGYNSPELKPRLLCLNREEIKTQAKAAKQKLSDLCGTQVEVEFGEFDSFGRVLANIYSTKTGGCVNHEMIEYTKIYGGKIM